MAAVVAGSFGRGYVGEHRLLAAAVSAPLEPAAPTLEAAAPVVEAAAVPAEADLVPADLSPARHLVAVPADPVAARLAQVEPAGDLDDTAPHPIVRLFPLPVEEPAVALPGDPEADTTVVRFVARG